MFFKKSIQTFLQIMSVYHLFLCGMFFPVIQSTVTVETGFKDYTKYEHGDMNIIISAPHGGFKRPSTQDNLDNWPDRAEYGCKDDSGAECVWTHNCNNISTDCPTQRFNDLYTRTIARDIADKIKEITGEGICQGFLWRIVLDNRAQARVSHKKKGREVLIGNFEKNS